MTTDRIGAPSPDAELVEVPGWRYGQGGVHRFSSESCPQVPGCEPLYLPRGLVEDLGRKS